jgi:glycine/D-amino acid oxidase-like deaminating enzyme
MPKNDVVIIGAGAIGCSIAYHLGKHGMRATVVERESIGTRASGKAWAVIAYPPTLFAEEEMHQAVVDSAVVDFSAMPEGQSIAGWHYLFSSSYERMPDLALEIAERGGIDVEYGESPNTLLLTEAELDRAGREELLAPYVRAGGVETGWLDAAQLREVFPSLSPEWQAGITNPEGQVEPYRYTLGLAQAAEQLGARMKQGEAVGFETQGDRITGLELASGEILSGDHFVIAAGPWSRPLASHLGVDIPMRMLMAECIRVDVPGGLPFQTLVAGDYWIIPKVNGEVILSPYVGSVSPRETYDDSLNEELKLQTLTDCAAILPALEQAKLLEHRGDLLAMPAEAPLQKPTLGRLPEWRNGYVATHFGGLGINMSPAAGELMAELIATGKPPLRAARTLDHLKLRS